MTLAAAVARNVAIAGVALAAFSALADTPANASHVKPLSEDRDEITQGPIRATYALVLEDSKFSRSLNLRLAGHDFLGPQQESEAVSEWRLIDFSLSMKLGENPRLTYLTLVEKTVLTPKPEAKIAIPWQFSTGFRRRPVAMVYGNKEAEQNNNLGFYVEGGPGLAWGDANKLLGYMFALTSLDANTSFSSDYALGVGASIGMLAQPTEYWRVQIEGGALDYIADENGSRRWAQIAQQWPLVYDLHLRLLMKIERANAETATGFSLGIGTYF